MSKSISRFEPTPSRAIEECERHYTEVHVRMAQNLLQPMQGIRSYHINRALAQADVSGGWSQRPRAWRFVVLRFEPDAELAFTPEQNEMVAQDHVNCLYRLRHCEVEETVLLDRIDRQYALAKFMVEADMSAGAAPETSRRAFDDLAARVLERMSGAFGARQLIVNHALTELECEPVEVEGQRPIGLLPHTRRLGYLEAYFDHKRWGEEALRELARDGSLRHPGLAEVNLLHVEEMAALSFS